MSTLRIALAQINPTIGDIDGNLALMVAAAQRAHAEGARLVAFPELSLTAYYPADLLEDLDFQRRLTKGIEDLLAATRELPDLHWVVGAPTPNAGIGKPLFNALLVVKNGEILLRYHKQLLPTYNIFDERRHFEPGPDVAKLLDVEGVRVGFMICEDGWNDAGRDYIVNPFERLADAAPDLVVSINASPSSIGRREMRHDIFAKASARHRLPLVYVNQVGGHDQLIYDGASFAVDPTRGIVMEGARFQPDLMACKCIRVRLFSISVATSFARSTQKAFRLTRSIASSWCWACATTRAAAGFPRRSSAAPAASTPPLRWRLL